MKTKTIGILTNFTDFRPAYSVSSIIIDQAHMLARQNHKVIIFVNEEFSDKHNDDVGITSLLEQYPDNIFIFRLTKFLNLIDYDKDELTKEHSEQIIPGAKVYERTIIDQGIEILFTHDFIYTGWNLPYYHMIKETSKRLKNSGHQVRWLHWIHSVPVFAGRKPWWTLEPLEGDHKIVFPNRMEQQLVAECFQCGIKNVLTIPHIKDIRNWYDFSQDSRDFIDMFPSMMDAEVIQVYPCSTDRLQAKQLDVVLRLFGFMKKNHIPVFLCIANQWATTTEHKEGISQWIDYGEAYGLVYGEDYAFTSISKEKWSIGISKRMVRELQLLSNLFIFPTVEESFGLVGPESAFAGVLPVTNKSLAMQAEVMSGHCPSFNFGSFNNNHDNNDNYLNAVAIAILRNLYGENSTMAKVYCRMRYNMESVYRRFYIYQLYN